MHLLGYNIDTDYPAFPVFDQKVINTINPHSYCVAKGDENFQKALKTSDVLIPDGIGIVWAARILKSKKIVKIAGADMHSYLIEQAQKHKLSLFYMGASQPTLEGIEERLQKEYPNVEVGSYSPPYKATFSDADSEVMIEQVNAFNPDILFVGLTAPKQEKWVYQHKEQLDATVICSIGAVFDFYGGTVKRPSKFWIDLGLEWLPRFLKEPKRLWRRNFISTPKFLLDVAKEKINI